MSFFYCYGHHRDLHSFPTRRSSDLVVEQAEEDLALELGARLEVEHGVFRRARPVRGRNPPRAAERRDRKSTRLNSSHVSISYAVFCLKKKNKQNARIPVQHKTHKDR